MYGSAGVETRSISSENQTLKELQQTCWRGREYIE